LSRGTISDTYYPNVDCLDTCDLVKSASALQASGQTATLLSSLIWMACVQARDGALPQNNWAMVTPTGTASGRAK